MGNTCPLQGAPLRAVGCALERAVGASDGIVRRAETLRVCGPPTEVTDNLIEIEGLRFSRGDRIIFDGLDLVVPRGRITALMGPSGTGKTMLFQSSALFTDLSVFENVAFPLRVHTNLPDEMIRDLVLMKLNSVGLRGARDLMPSQLSGGMSRRVALARTIALDPKFIMYDEPFTGQDPIAMGVLVSLIRGLNESLAMTSLVVSHDIHETASIADQMYIISDGRVIGEGTPDVLRDHPSTMVRQFMLGSPDGPVPFHYPADTFLDDVMGDA